MKQASGKTPHILSTDGRLIRPFAGLRLIPGYAPQPKRYSVTYLDGYDARKAAGSRIKCQIGLGNDFYDMQKARLQGWQLGSPPPAGLVVSPLAILDSFGTTNLVNAIIARNKSQRAEEE